MSHATVVVRISAARLASCGGDLETALAVMMAPFDEGTEDDRFREFEDSEDEYREEYENKGSEQVLMPDGGYKFPWDKEAEAFLNDLLEREPAKESDIFNRRRTPRTEDPRTFVERPYKLMYNSFEEFCAEYHGCKKRDEKTGRYGYWRNPNKTWDWYQIGGRWRGFFPVKKGVPPHVGKPGSFRNEAERFDGNLGSDVVRVSDIDMDTVAKKTREEAEAFYEEYAKLLADPLNAKLHEYGGARSRALDLGLVEVVQGPALGGRGAGKNGEMRETIAVPWKDVHPNVDETRASWTDTLLIITKAAFLAEYGHCFCPIAAYAALRDESHDGVIAPAWRAPGAMGWFGCHSAETDAYVAFKKGFVDTFIKGGDDTDTLVLVDYHI